MSMGRNITLVGLFALASLNACGKSELYEVNPAFSSQIDKWNATFSKPVEHMSIVFGSLQLPTIGLCQRDIHKITIDATFWNSASLSAREQLLFHELGHCIGGLEHVNTLRTGSACPISIMYPTLYQGCYVAFYNDYIADMKMRVSQ